MQFSSVTKNCLITTAWLLLGALCVAAQPKSVISPVGPISTTAPGGVVLHLDGSVYDLGYFWMLNDDLWAVEDTANGTIGLAYFGSAPFTTKVTLVTFGADPNGKPTPAKASVQISFGGAPVPPGPTPVPPVPIPPAPPGPVGPNLPDGKFKLAALAYTAAMQIGQSARGDASKVAAAVSSVATANASNLTTGYDAVKSAGDQLNAALATSFGSDAPAWQPWYLTVQGQVRSLYGQNNGINGVPDFCVAMNEISNGMGQVK